jgi:hypothetical protein
MREVWDCLLRADVPVGGLAFSSERMSVTDQECLVSLNEAVALSSLVNLCLGYGFELCLVCCSFVVASPAS